MLSRLFQRRTIWWPTLPGWTVILFLGSAPVLLWGFFGESFLSRNNPLPAQALVVEGWIGYEGIEAAKAEFEKGGYVFVVTAGGLSPDGGWSGRRWNFAEIARDRLVSLGVPPEKTLLAYAPNQEVQRTFHSALAVRETLVKNHLHPASVNIFTLGVHVRRSEMIFAKVLSPEIKVGGICWVPRAQKGHWWSSSDRAEAFVKETVGWLFECLFNSGRFSNS